MLSTPKLAGLAALADHMEWRVVLVGDPLQFSAVGRSGIFQHLIEHAPDGAAVEHLERVHRFDAECEAAARLRLRQGDATAADRSPERRTGKECSVTLSSKSCAEHPNTKKKQTHV